MTKQLKRKARLIKNKQRVYAWISDVSLTGPDRLVRGRRIK